MLKKFQILKQWNRHNTIVEYVFLQTQCFSIPKKNGKYIKVFLHGYLKYKISYKRNCSMQEPDDRNTWQVIWLHCFKSCNARLRQSNPYRNLFFYLKLQVNSNRMKLTILCNILRKSIHHHQSKKVKLISLRLLKTNPNFILHTTSLNKKPTVT